MSQRKGYQDFATVVCDIDRSKLLELSDSHHQEDIIAILKQQPLELRAQVEEVSVDMWGGFPKVVQEVFPKAQIVFDRFHVMKPVNEQLNRIRKQTRMTVKGSKLILLKNRANLSEEEQLKLASILGHSHRLKLAYELKEEFRDIFETCNTPEEGKVQLLQWLKKARTVYCDVLTTIRNHLDGICNYFLSAPKARSDGGN